MPVTARLLCRRVSLGPHCPIGPEVTAAAGGGTIHQFLPLQRTGKKNSLSYRVYLTVYYVEETHALENHFCCEKNFGGRRKAPHSPRFCAAPHTEARSPAPLFLLQPCRCRGRTCRRAGPWQGPSLCRRPCQVRMPSLRVMNSEANGGNRNLVATHGLALCTLIT